MSVPISIPGPVRAGLHVPAEGEQAGQPGARGLPRRQHRDRAQVAEALVGTFSVNVKSPRTLV